MKLPLRVRTDACVVGRDLVRLSEEIGGVQSPNELDSIAARVEGVADALRQVAQAARSGGSHAA